MERVYPCSNKIVCICWSHDSRLLCYGSNDMTIHVVGFVKFENLRDCQIGGHTNIVIGSYFQSNNYDLFTVTRHGFLSMWSCSMKVEDLIVAKNLFKRKPENPDSEDDVVPDEENNEDMEKIAKKKRTRFLTYSRKSKTSLSKYLKKENVTATSSSYKPETRVMVVAFGSGDFLILDLSGDDHHLIHVLNISHSTVTSTCINSSGDWVALGVSGLGQIVVWEWQSETHILKQQGHFNSMKVISYSPDGLYLVTGGDDGKVKIWSTESSFCFMTFEEHKAEVTGVVFTQSGKAIITCSLDGTVRAFDMIRYRNFKTLTSLKATQFSCVTVDSSGELVAAGGQDSHNIYLWSLQRGSLLEILGGHEGPIVSIQFSLRLGSSKLISTSWDKTVKVWDAIANTTAKETLPLFSDGTCVAFKPDGEQFAVATMNGHITMFNADTLRQEYCIEGKNDLGAWQEDTDKVHANVNLKANYFSTISYSPNGEYIIGGGKSKYVCIYSVKDELTN
ncbi:Periodic tryptophan protein 2-like protein [Armadillidium nasatum]|uniref:Periodic tryptophan protein 2-like protein n=1 Tax=Armadillidium nasatum TaxID=96803 RepID=A0A5N5TLF4_9CRUS|nr:Periodic tryptophan protein 2-like protein [Armadillidium nasatum]